MLLIENLSFIFLFLQIAIYLSQTFYPETTS